MEASNDDTSDAEQPTEAFGVAAEMKVFLASKGVDLLADQQIKTRTALDFFAGELAAGELAAGARA